MLFQIKVSVMYRLHFTVSLLPTHQDQQEVVNSENTAINSYNQLEEYSSSNVNQVISGGHYTNQLQELKHLPNSLNNQFTTNNMKSSQVIDPTADDNILTTILQENSGNQLIKQIQKVNL